MMPILAPYLIIICLFDDIQIVSSSFKPPQNPTKWYYYQSNLIDEKTEPQGC